MTAPTNRYFLTAGTWRDRKIIGGSYDWQNVDLSRHESQSLGNAIVCSPNALGVADDCGQGGKDGMKKWVGSKFAA